jgi:hypothetical protein
MAEASIPFGASIGDHLEEIRQAGERARNLVDQILAFGRREKSAPQRIRLRSLLDETASLLAATMPPETRLVMGAAPDTAIVSGEPAQLQQVIINLCHNAAQAMNGAGVVEVTTDLRDISEPMSLTHGHLLPGRYVRIAVRDSGHGIGKEAFERIFEPFFTTRSAGHGLGLPTVRSIIGEHGGAMDVSSTPGQGSLFTAWLPQITLVPDREAEAPLSLTGKGETILLVDDDTNGLLRGEEIIAALGYEPVGFATAEGALSACYAAPERFDAVVIGHLAPLQKVLDFAVRLQEMVPRSPILLCAAAEEIGAETLASVGIAELVPRSFTTAVMASALGRLLASPMVVRRPRAAHDR